MHMHIPEVIHDDCVAAMKGMADNTFDAIVCDPPYDLTAGKKGGTGEASLNLNSPAGRSRISTIGRGFMGKPWDATGIAFDPDTWRECLRVLKPGGHLLSFCGTRTAHRIISAIDNAGFEIRDSIAYIFGNGFPKGIDVSKAIDKMAGAERDVVGTNEDYLRRKPNGMKTPGASVYGYSQTDYPTNADITAPATNAAKQWDGWNSSLKPAFETIACVRKPLSEKTVTANVLAYSTGALNVNACRIAASDSQLAEKYASVRNAPPRENVIYGQDNRARSDGNIEPHPLGRWPSNVILDEHAADELGERAKFFYCAKAPKRERPIINGVSHPTTKPLTLMRWLCRLVTPFPDGKILDPFAGSGTTLEAAMLEGFRSVGIESEADYIPLIQQRIDRTRDKGVEH